jgi:hypothetical protein
LPIPDVWTVSPATIRNELAELVNMGYLEQPHTSAGRVPTPQGYRIYVNELMERQKLSLEESEEINRSLNEKLRQLDSAMTDIGKLASQLTDYPALALTAPAPATIQRFRPHICGRQYIYNSPHDVEQHRKVQARASAGLGDAEHDAEAFKPL